ncbi:MAG: L-arabinose isomerase [Planctomycetia bacterium]|nr:L-arabinose isomerase [Planctomycetia bacterium]
MDIYKSSEIWFVTGAQLLYGDDIVQKVNAQSQTIVDGLNQSQALPLRIIYKGTVNTAEEITDIFNQANIDKKCVGVITWMHTFSPAKMWVHGLKSFYKPLLHLHTQYDREIPWASIDMNYMNLNQSAHGDREFGFIVSRLRKNRKIVAGYWNDLQTQSKIGLWMRVCVGWADQQSLRLIRFGDNMNNVAVTDGDKVEAERRLGYHVDYFSIGDLVDTMQTISEQEIKDLVALYEEQYVFEDNVKVNGKDRLQVIEAAREELAIRKFLAEKKANAFTTSFDALHGMNQLPGLAAQRLMADGYGFGAEGDWKTAALVRLFKVMTAGLSGGSSFIEDYVLHFKEDGAILQAHMLEICPSISRNKPRMEVHPLSIGGKADPARLVFTAHEGKGLTATIVDMGNRFRMIVSKVDCLSPEEDLPKLPVARAFWKPEPDLETGTSAWILAGGTHHSAFSFDLTLEQIIDYAEIADMELVIIDENTDLYKIKESLKLNEVYYALRGF